MNHLSQTLHFHPLAIEDCIQRLQRPKLDYYENFNFIVTHPLLKDFSKSEINFFIGDPFIVSFHHYNSEEVNTVLNRLCSLENHEEIKKWDPYYIFHQILDKIVDNYFPKIYSIEDSLGDIEYNADTKKNVESLLDDLFDLRQRLLILRHTVNPMRDLLYRMLNSAHLQGIQKRKAYFSDVYDHLLKLSSMITSNREITADIRDSYLSLNAHQTNHVMKVLTIITSIFVPLTFITGVFGMNFHFMPILSVKYAYYGTLGFMALISIFMIIWFKRKGWF